MRLLLPGLYWALISLHVLGGARLFQRLFPRESPWFGFVVPALVFVLALNFIEHIVALPVLFWLLPFTTLGSLYLLLNSEADWRGLKLPSGIFLVAFAVTLALRLVKPDISLASSGTYDLPLIASYCLGEKLPASFCWFPPYPFGQYYALLHYAASVLTRLLGTDVGTGYNLSTALLSAWIVLAAGAIAWRVSRQRVWVTILAAAAIQCASNGPSPLLWLERWPVDPGDAADVFNDMAYPQIHPLLMKVLQPVDDPFARRELEVPGFWSWYGAFHATNGGQFLTLLSVWSLAELLRRRRANWPWITLVVTPALMLVTSTWGVPFVGILMVVGLAVALFRGLWPQNLRLLLALLAGFAFLLLPVLNDFLPSEISVWRTPTLEVAHTQFLEFFIYWWPVVILWFAVMFVWRRVGPLVRIVWVLAPLCFWAVEDYTIGARFDMTGKLWGYLWGLAWCALFPAIAVRRAWGFRTVLVLLAAANAISLAGWINWTWRTRADSGTIGRLDGRPSFADDPAKRQVFAVLQLHRGQLFLAGLTSPYSTQGAMLVAFTRNLTPADNTFYVDGFFCPDAGGMAAKRASVIEDFYVGRLADPLAFVRQQNLEGIIIWPDDRMSDARVAELTRQLTPLYEYRDFHAPGGPNAGIFFYRGP